MTFMSAILHKINQPSIIEIIFKITYLKFHSNICLSRNKIEKKIIAIKGGPVMFSRGQFVGDAQNIDLVTEVWKSQMQNSHISQEHMTFKLLTHWGRVTHICVGNLTIIGSDNGLSPGRRQAII